MILFTLQWSTSGIIRNYISIILEFLIVRVFVLDRDVEVVVVGEVSPIEASKPLEARTVLTR